MRLRQCQSDKFTLKWRNNVLFTNFTHECSTVRERKGSVTRLFRPCRCSVHTIFAFLYLANVWAVTASSECIPSSTHMITSTSTCLVWAITESRYYHRVAYAFLLGIRKLNNREYTHILTERNHKRKKNKNNTGTQKLRCFVHWRSWQKWSGYRSPSHSHSRDSSYTEWSSPLYHTHIIFILLIKFIWWSGKCGRTLRARKIISICRKSERLNEMK